MSKLFILLISEYQHNRHTSQVEILAELVFKITLVRFLDVLRQVCEEGKHWSRRWQLSDILYLDVLALG